MANLSELFAKIAEQASYFNEPVLTHLCRMAALEASNTAVPLCYKEETIVGIWDWDVANDVNHMDPDCAVAFGITPHQGRVGVPNDVLLGAVHPEDLGPMMQIVNGVMTRGGVYEAYFRLITDQREKPVFARGFCTLDNSNRPERFPGVVMDLS
jgi:PAS domain-containing protein